MSTSYRYIKGFSCISRLTREQRLEEEMRDPIIRKVVLDSCGIIIPSIDAALAVIDEYYNNLIKNKLDSIPKEELKEILKNNLIITSSGELITDTSKFLFNKLEGFLKI